MSLTGDEDSRDFTVLNDAPKREAQVLREKTAFGIGEINLDLGKRIHLEHRTLFFALVEQERHVIARGVEHTLGKQALQKC